MPFSNDYFTSTLRRTIPLKGSLLCGVVCCALFVTGFAGAQPSGVSEEALDVWRDPAFQKRFAESYMAETDIEPRVDAEEREVMQEILDLISTERMDEAADLLRNQLEREETASAVFDFTLANIYFQQDQLDEAVPYYESAVEKFPKFRRALKNLSLIHVRKNRFEEALPVLTKVVELGGADSITYGLLGYSYSSVENFLSAESAYRMAILLDPETLDWKMGLARAFFKQERFAEAIALCRQLVERFPERTDLWLLQANAYIGLGQPMEAAEIYEIVDHMGGSTADSLNMLGDIYINEELYELASGSYIRAMESDEEANANRAIRSARILAARGAFDETKQLVSKIEQIHGNGLETDERKDLLKLRGRLAVAEGAGDEEVSILEEIIEIDPLDGEALILLGQHSRRNEDVEQAAFYFERAAAIEGFEADASVRHAQLLVGDGRYEEALPLLRRAQQIKFRENVQEYLEQVERVARTR